MGLFQLSLKDSDQLVSVGIDHPPTDAVGGVFGASRTGKCEKTLEPLSIIPSRCAGGFMATDYLKNLMKIALERTQEREGAKEDDPALVRLKDSVVLTIAELEVAQIGQTKSAAPMDEKDQEDDLTMSNAA